MKNGNGEELRQGRQVWAMGFVVAVLGSGGWDTHPSI